MGRQVEICGTALSEALEFGFVQLEVLVMVSCQIYLRVLLPNAALEPSTLGIACWLYTYRIRSNEPYEDRRAGLRSCGIYICRRGCFENVMEDEVYRLFIGPSEHNAYFHGMHACAWALGIS